jgi:hypothetical protein
VKQSDIGEYEENVREKIAIRMQIRKNKRFGENVGQLFLCVCVSQLNVSLLYMIYQEVASPFKVSHSLMEDWIFGYGDGTGVVANEGNSLKAHSKVSHGVHNPYDLETIATYSASVMDWTTDDCFQEEQQMREDPRK